MGSSELVLTQTAVSTDTAIIFAQAAQTWRCANSRACAVYRTNLQRGEINNLENSIQFFFWRQISCTLEYKNYALCAVRWRKIVGVMTWRYNRLVCKGRKRTESSYVNLAYKSRRYSNTIETYVNHFSKS